jgi:hypothetical protein
LRTSTSPGCSCSSLKDDSRYSKFASVKLPFGKLTCSHRRFIFIGIKPSLVLNGPSSRRGALGPLEHRLMWIGDDTVDHELSALLPLVCALQARLVAGGQRRPSAFAGKLPGDSEAAAAARAGDQGALSC